MEIVSLGRGVLALVMESVFSAREVPLVGVMEILSLGRSVLAMVISNTLISSLFSSRVFEIWAKVR
jgi:hypothetical protein